MSGKGIDEALTTDSKLDRVLHMIEMIKKDLRDEMATMKEDLRKEIRKESEKTGAADSNTKRRNPK